MKQAERERLVNGALQIEGPVIRDRALPAALAGGVLLKTGQKGGDFLLFRTGRGCQLTLLNPICVWFYEYFS